MSQPVQDNANIIIDNLNAVINPTTTTISPTASPSPSLAQSADQVVIDQLNRLILPPEPLPGCRIIGNITFTLNGKLIVIKSAEFCTGAAKGKRLIHDGVTENGTITIVSNKDKYVPTTSVPTTNVPTDKLSQSQNNATVQRQNLNKSIQETKLKLQQTSDPKIIVELNNELLNLQKSILELNDRENELNKPKGSSHDLAGNMISHDLSTDNSTIGSSHQLSGKNIISHDLSTDNSTIGSSHDLAGKGKGKIISHDL